MPRPPGGDLVLHPSWEEPRMRRRVLEAAVLGGLLTVLFVVAAVLGRDGATLLVAVVVAAWYVAVPLLYVRRSSITVTASEVVVRRVVGGVQSLPRAAVCDVRIEGSGRRARLVMDAGREAVALRLPAAGWGDGEVRQLREAVGLSV